MVLYAFVWQLLLIFNISRVLSSMVYVNHLQFLLLLEGKKKLEIIFRQVKENFELP